MLVNARDAVAIPTAASPAHTLAALVRSLCILIPLKFGPPGGLAVWFEAIKGGRAGGGVRGHNGWEMVVQLLKGSISPCREVFLTKGEYFFLKGTISPWEYFY